MEDELFTVATFYCMHDADDHGKEVVVAELADGCCSIASGDSSWSSDMLKSLSARLRLRSPPWCLVGGHGRGGRQQRKRVARRARTLATELRWPSGLDQDVALDQGSYADSALHQPSQAPLHQRPWVLVLERGLSNSRRARAGAISSFGHDDPATGLRHQEQGQALGRGSEPMPFALADLVVLDLLLRAIDKTGDNRVAAHVVEDAATHCPGLMQWLCRFVRYLVLCGSLDALLLGKGAAHGDNNDNGRENNADDKGRMGGSWAWHWALRVAAQATHANATGDCTSVGQQTSPGIGTTRASGEQVEVTARDPLRLSKQEKRRRRRQRVRSMCASLAQLGAHKLLGAGLLPAILHWPHHADDGNIKAAGDVTNACVPRAPVQLLDWESLPASVHPGAGFGAGSGLSVGGRRTARVGSSSSRTSRKQVQVEAMVQRVLVLLPPGGTVVEFCSGCGHIGLPVAALRPDAHVILTDQNGVHLARARARASVAGLQNVSTFCADARQCNTSGFSGGSSISHEEQSDHGLGAGIDLPKFDVGTALHACGAATDMVLQACAMAQAAFVVSPCCYGWLQNHAEAAAAAAAAADVAKAAVAALPSKSNAVFAFPRSAAYREAGVTHNDMATVSACADATILRSEGSQKRDDERDVEHGQAVRQPFPRGGSSQCEVNTVDLLNEWRIRCAASEGRDKADARARLCMAVIDTDRLRALREEHGYEVSAHLMPRECTPKNHILVGVFQNGYLGTTCK